MLQEFFQQYFGPVVVLIVLAIALTIFVFRKRKFERGPRKGVAANPQQVKKENRPDEWSRSH
jgi:hypothetical protein